MSWKLEEIEVLNHMSANNKQNKTIKVEQLSALAISSPWFMLGLIKCKYDFDIFLQGKLTHEFGFDKLQTNQRSL